MNDFTKEELEIIRNGIFCAMGSSSLWRTDTNNSLVDKIQSMIDNYCEHECHHEWDGVLITTKPNTGKCKKCHQVCYIAIKDIE